MMNKIRFIANKDTNYVFHMLSVAKCGYDNAYGDHYKHLYLEDDLALLKQNEKLITVCGGEYCGILYGTLVSEPACARISAKEYYIELIKMAENNQVPEEFEEYIEIVCQISEVMIKYYDTYIHTIWDIEKKKIIEYIPIVLDLFEKSNFTEKAEEIVGCRLGSDFFTATLVTSVENGAEAIDISNEQDLFGIVREPVDAFYFIGHEFIIYLLFEALKNENAFKNFSTWYITEGLAEFYLKQVMGDIRFFDAQKKYADYFEKCYCSEKLTAVELYRKGIKRYVSYSDM